ncbi:MAG: hydrogenase maturation nickel metallochaperone HypA [Geothrix sp.]|nr:hydrogenase maturation nickel metallochaperone HypA [Geothrix sp.]
MHELSLLEGMIQGLEEEARERGFSRVAQIRLEVGRLAGAEVEALRFAFGPATQDTLADGATLEIIEIPGVGICRTCGREVEIEARFDPCPACGEGFVDVTGGASLRILDIDVEGGP